MPASPLQPSSTVSNLIVFSRVSERRMQADWHSQAQSVPCVAIPDHELHPSFEIESRPFQLGVTPFGPDASALNDLDCVSFHLQFSRSDLLTYLENTPSDMSLRRFDQLELKSKIGKRERLRRLRCFPKHRSILRRGRKTGFVKAC